MRNLVSIISVAVLISSQSISGQSTEKESCSCVCKGGKETPKLLGISEQNSTSANIPDDDSCQTILTNTTVVVSKRNLQAYGTINDYLIDHLKEDDPEANMRLVVKLFNSTQVVPVESRIIKAIANLTALGGLEVCTKSNLDILIANDQATEGRTRRLFYKKIVPRRIEKLVNHYITKYAKDCQSSHQSDFRAQKGRLDAKIEERVRNFTDSFINQDMDTYSDKEGLTYGMYTRYIKGAGSGIYDGALMRKKIAAYAREKEDPDEIFLNSTIDERKGKKYTNQEKLNDLYKRYLVKPCESYVDALGKDVFESLDYEDDWYHEIDREDYEFYLTWTRYTLCRWVINEQFWMVSRITAAIVDS